MTTASAIWSGALGWCGAAGTAHTSKAHEEGRPAPPTAEQLVMASAAPDPFVQRVLLVLAFRYATLGVSDMDYPVVADDHDASLPASPETYPPFPASR